MAREKEKEYAKLGKTVEQILIKDYEDLVRNWKRLLLLSFARGVAAGLGGVIGATAVVATLVWLFSLFDTLPLIGDWLQSTGETIRNQ